MANLRPWGSVSIALTWPAETYHSHIHIIDFLLLRACEGNRKSQLIFVSTSILMHLCPETSMGLLCYLSHFLWWNLNVAELAGHSVVMRPHQHPANDCRLRVYPDINLLALRVVGAWVSLLWWPTAFSDPSAHCAGVTWVSCRAKCWLRKDRGRNKFMNESVLILQSM